MRSLILALSVVTSLLIPSAARAKGPPKVMVLEIPRDEAFKPTVIQAINEFLAGAIRDQGFEVLTSSDMVAVLGIERQRQLLGCADTSCMAELGGALGSAYLVHGTLAVLDQDSALTLSLVDASGAASTCVVVGDFNLDGIPDLAITSYGGPSVTVLLGQGCGP